MWIVDVGKFDLEFKYHRGKKNFVDCLSDSDVFV